MFLEELKLNQFKIFTMNHYTAQIIYRIICDGVHSEQYEEQWRLIEALDERHAIQKSKEVGLKEEATFVDRHGRTISWQMIAVKEIVPIEIKDGSLLFSSVKEIEPIADPVWTLIEQRA